LIKPWTTCLRVKASSCSPPTSAAADRRTITLPEHIGVSNAGPIREELLSVINRGAQALIADLTATISCDHAGADAWPAPASGPSSAARSCA
jgi:hypothetical protein